MKLQGHERISDSVITSLYYLVKDELFGGNAHGRRRVWQDKLILLRKKCKVGAEWCEDMTNPDQSRAMQPLLRLPHLKRSLSWRKTRRFRKVKSLKTWEKKVVLTNAWESIAWHQNSTSSVWMRQRKWWRKTGLSIRVRFNVRGSRKKMIAPCW